MCVGNVWSFERFFLRACKILFHDSSNSRLYTPISGSSSRRRVSPYSLGISLLLEVVKPVGWPQLLLAWGWYSDPTTPIPSLCPSFRSSVHLVEQVLVLMASHHVLHLLLSDQSLQLVSVQFSLIVPLVLPPIPIPNPVALPSLFYATLVLLWASTLPLVTSFLLLPIFSSPSFSMILSFHVVTSLHLSPKLLSQQVDPL